MDIIFNTLRKILVGTLLLIFAFVFTYIPQDHTEIPQAEAFIGGAVVEVGPNLIANATETVRTFTLNGIAFAIAKAILSSMIASTINWINRGFEGSPAFLTDLKRSVIDAADVAVGEYLRELGGIASFICSPFRLDIQVVLALEYQRARERRPIEGCRLSDMVNNVEDFFDASFERMEWNDFFTIISRPQEYTPYGQLLTARSEMGARIVNAQGQVLVEAGWGNGFLSGKICEVIEGPKGKGEKCTITKPGNMIADSLNKAVGAGQDSLIAADEINELISALIGALANKALTGAAGLLGLTPDTGFTEGGFSGGSYTAAASAEAQNNLNQRLSAPSNQIVSSAGFNRSLTIQNEVIDMTIEYIALLSIKNSNASSDEERRVVRSATNVAVTARDKAISLLPQITTLKNEFETLEAERSNAATTIERKQDILDRQVQINTEFLSLQAFTAESRDALKQTLEDALNY